MSVYEWVFQPPEVNSALVWTGPGSGTLNAAAVAWADLSYELTSAATLIENIVADMSTFWLGPSSLAMQLWSRLYTGHLATTASSAQVTAVQAAAAGAAYDAAQASTVHPLAVTANRTTLQTLIATDFLGINLPAIATTEADYLEMWAQDVTAMTSYATTSDAITSALPSWLTELLGLDPSTIGSAFESALFAAIFSLPIGLASLFASLYQGYEGQRQADAATNAANQPSQPQCCPQPTCGANCTPSRGAIVGGGVTRLQPATTSGYTTRALQPTATMGSASRVGGLSVPRRTESGRDTSPIMMAPPLGAIPQGAQESKRATPEYGFISRVMPDVRF